MHIQKKNTFGKGISRIPYSELDSHHLQLGTVRSKCDCTGVINISMWSTHSSVSWTLGRGLQHLAPPWVFPSAGFIRTSQHLILTPLLASSMLLAKPLTRQLRAHWVKLNQGNPCTVNGSKTSQLVSALRVSCHTVSSI